jgi:2,3-bisphosphoglycerate-dependent phosphoglycerate mutase
MAAMQLLLIRHAESVNNLLATQHEFAEYMRRRSPDPSITERGFVQADALARHAEKVDYGITDILVSPMLRAVQTARPLVAALNLQPRMWVAIHEDGGMFTGDPSVPESVRGYGGLTRAEFTRDHPEFELVDEITEDGWSTAGWEDRAACHARAIRVAADLVQRARSEQTQGIGSVVALVSHGTFLDALIKALFGHLPDERHHYFLNNTALSLLDLSRPERIRLRYLNRTEHLPAELVTV